MLKLPPEALVHSFGGLLRNAHHGLDVDFKATVQQLVYLPVIIIVISEETEASAPSGERKGGHTTTSKPCRGQKHSILLT